MYIRCAGHPTQAKPVAAVEPKAVQSVPVTVTAGAQVPGQFPVASQGVPLGQESSRGIPEGLSVTPQASHGTPHSWPLQARIIEACLGSWDGLVASALLALLFQAV